MAARASAVAASGRSGMTLISLPPKAKRTLGNARPGEPWEPSIDAFMNAHPDVERRHLVPSDAGLDRLGHFGYSKWSARNLWPEAISWLQSQAPGEPPPR